MSDIAVKAENISKYYRLGQINNGTLYADIQSWFARKFGKEDPHAKIGFDSSQSDKEGFWALKDINFEIKQGDRVGIIGRNGAGKSTLLKVISEITKPTTGDLYIKGRVASLLEVGTGFHPEMTGRENIYMNGSILGMKKAEITRHLDEIIAFSELEKYIDTPVKRYSSGMYVRLAFAVAAHLDSEILIADEVLAVGDAAFQKKALGKMNELSTGQGRTVLFVSHNMAQVKSLCNKGMVLDKGLISYNGNIDEAKDYYIGNTLEDKKIIDYKKEHSSTFILSSISINDSENTEQLIPFNTDRLIVKIQGTSQKNQNADLMMVFKNLEGVPLACFSIGHFKGETINIPKGNFDISYEIQLPRYMGQGQIIADIYIHHPGTEGLVDLENSVRFTFEGNKSEFGNALKINGSGFASLDGRVL